MSTDHLAALISAVGTELGVDDLHMDADGSCALEVDERFIIAIHANEGDDALCFYVDLGVPARGAEMYLELLRANLIRRAADATILSLSYDDPPHAVIGQTVPLHGHDGTSLARTVQSFVIAAEGWAEQVGSTQPSVRSEEDGRALSALLTSRV